MNYWIKRIHLYTGLSNFTVLMVYGIAGLTATFEASPAARPRPQAVVEFRNFRLPANLTDQHAAEAVYTALGFSLAGPPPGYTLRRDAGHNLSFDLYSVNGTLGVTVLEAEGRLRLEQRRNDVWEYINNLHATTSGETAPDWRLRTWAWYNEFAMWSLIWMSVSGVYLWLASRPRFRWAQVSIVAGSGAFLALYVLTK